MSQLILTPHVSEKAHAMAERGAYVFIVPTDANKIEVAKVVEQTFNVKVAAVNMLVAKGKVVRGRDRKRTPGRRSDTKKAMVTLQKGDKIGLFEEGK